MPWSGFFDAAVFLLMASPRGRIARIHTGKSGSLFLHTESMLAHQARSAGDCGIWRVTKRSDDLLLLVSGAVLTEFEFCFEFRDGNFEAHDVAEHAAAVGLVQAHPLLSVGGLEGGDEVVKHVEQL